MLFSVIVIALTVTACSTAEPTVSSAVVYSVNTTAWEEHIASTAEHGATGAVVGTTNTQELTNKTLNASVLKGTFTNSGTVTLPTFNQNGAINFVTGQIYRTVNNSATQFRGGTDSSGSSAMVALYGKDHGYGGWFLVKTPDTAKTSDIERLRITGNADSAEVEVSNISKFSVASYLTIGQNYFYLTEMTEPASGASNTAKIYAKEGSGDNLTDLCAIFQDGTIDIFAQETTPLDAPIFTLPSGSLGALMLLKPHAGLVKVVMLFPDNQYIVLKEIEYHDKDKIEANRGCISDKLPAGWLVETEQDREARLLLEEVE